MYIHHMKSIIIAVCVLAAVLLPSCSKNDNRELYQEIKSVDKIVFASMAINKIAKLDRTWPVIGKRIAVYSYNSYMRAYVDLSDLQIEDLVFDEDTKTVKLTLPPVMTEITGRDMEMHKEYENVGIMRSELDSKERAEIKEMANASFKKEVEENNVFKQQLIDEAERKARKYFEAIFEANGYTASIYFKPSNPLQS